MCVSTAEGDASMWKPLASLFCSGVTALPLIGCAGNITAMRQAPPVPTVADTGPITYATGSASPATVLVLQPSVGAIRGEDFLAANPALWTAQGFGVVVPQPAEIYQLATDQQREIARLVAAARALAGAPVWLVGPRSGDRDRDRRRTADRRRPDLGCRGHLDGLERDQLQRERILLRSRHRAAPKVTVKQSGTGCDTLQPFAGGHQPSVVPVPPQPRLTAPRIIEASAVARPLPQAAQEPVAHNLAELIKVSPPG
jgi:hypothetical protein